MPLNYVDLWQMESDCGRCCNHSIRWLADGIVTLWDCRCYCLCGRWNGHIEGNDFNYGRCYCLFGRWNSHWVMGADGICIYFCSGMDCWSLCILILLSASCYMVFVFGCHQEVFDGPTPFKVYLYAMFLAYIFYAFTEAFSVWYHYVISFDVRVGTVVC